MTCPLRAKSAALPLRRTTHARDEAARARDDRPDHRGRDARVRAWADRGQDNEAGRLEEGRVSVRGATEQLVVKDIEYNARGQRVVCEHAPARDHE